MKKENKKKGLLVVLGIFTAGILLSKDRSPGTDQSLPRGIRNNNIGNIKYNSNNTWLGKVSNNTDGTFEQFTDKKYGTRALIMLIKKYLRDYNLDTIRSILARYAPNSENSTSTYVNFVSDRVGYSPDTTIDKTNLVELIEAIAYFENGQPATSYNEIYNVSDEFNLGL